MVEKLRNPKKVEYFRKMESLVDRYSKILIIEVDNVGSKQLNELRNALRNKAVILMGKNTLIRRALIQSLDKVPQLSALVELTKLNIGFVFCSSEAAEVRSIILEKKRPEFARQGSIAPVDVFIQAGTTGLEPSQTSFFQALGIATKIVRGQIEIQSKVHLIKEGEKVSASAASLLQKLNVKPFVFGVTVKQVYDDGDVYDSSMLDISAADIVDMFKNGITDVAAMGLALDIPSAATVSHSLIGAFRTTVAMVINSDYTFPEMQMLREES